LIRTDVFFNFFSLRELLLPNILFNMLIFLYE
jgi:hypothetical protein